MPEWVVNLIVGFGGVFLGALAQPWIKANFFEMQKRTVNIGFFAVALLGELASIREWSLANDRPELNPPTTIVYDSNTDILGMFKPEDVWTIATRMATIKARLIRSPSEEIRADVRRIADQLSDILNRRDYLGDPPGLTTMDYCEMM